jgi:hypothetical protein
VVATTAEDDSFDLLDGDTLEETFGARPVRRGVMLPRSTRHAESNLVI